MLGRASQIRKENGEQGFNVFHEMSAILVGHKKKKLTFTERTARPEAWSVPFPAVATRKKPRAVHDPPRGVRAERVEVQCREEPPLRNESNNMLGEGASQSVRRIRTAECHVITRSRYETVWVSTHLYSYSRSEVRDAFAIAATARRGRVLDHPLRATGAVRVPA